MTTTTRPKPPTRQIVMDRLGFTPTGPEQEAVLDATSLDSGPLNIMVTGGERAGKSFLIAFLILLLIVESDRPLLIWLVGKKYENTTPEYDFLVGFLRELNYLKNAPAGSVHRPRVITCKDGTEIKTLSADDTTNIGRESPDIIAGCEAAQMSLEAFRKLRARITAAMNGILFLVGTLEPSQAEGWFPHYFNLWKAGKGMRRAYTIPSRSNFHLYPEGDDSPKLLEMREDVGEEFYLERFEGIQRTMEGLVFGKDFNIDMHVQDVEYIEGLDVWIAVDPGWNRGRHALLAVQFPTDRPIQVFDEIYERYCTTEDMIHLATHRPWWKDVVGGAIDVADTFNKGGSSPPAQIWAVEAQVALTGQKIPIHSGIERVKSFLRVNYRTEEPGIVFAPVCQGILSEFGAVVNPHSKLKEPYIYEMDRQGNFKSATPSTEHCDAMKALWYLLVKRFGYVTIQHPEVSRDDPSKKPLAINPRRRF